MGPRHGVPRVLPGCHRRPRYRVGVLSGAARTRSTGAAETRTQTRTARRHRIRTAHTAHTMRYTLARTFGANYLT